MVYPFDVTTGSELTNSSITENGFRLDLAKSRYLNVNLKREMLTESADGLVEDTRFNGPARDGAEYTDEGIYTITATNEYTGQFTVKKIYVGTNNVLRAYMATGLSIPEINDLVDQGAIIADDGTIQLATAVQTTPEASKNEKTKESITSLTNPNEDENTPSEKEEPASGFLISLAIGVIVICIIVGIIIFKKKIRNKSIVENNESIEGGTEE